MVTPEQTRQWLAARGLRRVEARRGLADQVRARWPEAVAHLRAAGATRAWLFGSVARGEAREDSDVDVAVEGLPRDAYLRAADDLVAIFGRSVDLVEWEGASPSLRRRVEAEGVAGE